MARPRFFAPGFDPSAAPLVLPADESHHLVSVLRLAAGEEIIVFDGDGREYLARVDRPDRKGTTVRILEPLPVPPESSVRTILVQAVLKGDGMDAVVRDATMAGATRIVPVVTERTLVSLATLGRSHATDRWRRISIASAKQCRRARLPVVEEPLPLTAWLQAPFDGLRLLFAEPGEGPEGNARTSSLRAALGRGKPRAVACIVGPEGGWSNDEREAAIGAGCVAVTLGAMTLRADAAGLVALSLVSFALAEA